LAHALKAKLTLDSVRACREGRLRRDQAAGAAKVTQERSKVLSAAAVRFSDVEALKLKRGGAAPAKERLSVYAAEEEVGRDRVRLLALPRSSTGKEEAMDAAEARPAEIETCRTGDGSSIPPSARGSSSMYRLKTDA
jgi:hypothetical protein